MSKTLTGRCALVTGSTSGIGLGIARSFAAAGADVVLSGRGSRGDARDAIATVAAHGTRVHYEGADLTKPAEARRIVAAATGAFGRVDILVNNAGMQHVAPIEEFPDDKWDAILALNLSAAFHAIKAVVPQMRARKAGRILNICSAHSLRASPDKSAYVAAKHGLDGLTKVVALETADAGITVNAISPGFVWTPLVEKQIPDVASRNGVSQAEAKRLLLGKQATGEFATVEQVGALATFLAGDDAAQITGANYTIDGGWTAQ